MQEVQELGGDTKESWHIMHVEGSVQLPVVGVRLWPLLWPRWHITSERRCAVSSPLFDRTQEIVELRRRREELSRMLPSFCKSPEDQEIIRKEVLHIDSEVKRKLHAIGRKRQQ